MTDRRESRGDVSPAEAFELLGSDARVDVLRALAAAERERATADEPYALTFSELYDRVDAASTSTFAYHLDRLSGVFVHETDAGYRLTGTGERVTRAILAGTYNERPSLEPTTVPGACVACDGRTLEATFDGEMLVVSCADCGERLVTEGLLPGQVRGRTPAEVVASCASRIHAECRMALEGVCPVCGGRTATDVERVDHHGDVVIVVLACLECDRVVSLPLELALVYHPAVVTFHWRHGVDLLDEPLWELLARLADDWERAPDGDDAWQVRFGCGDDELRLTVTEALSVTDVSVLSASAPGAARAPLGATPRDDD